MKRITIKLVKFGKQGNTLQLETRGITQKSDLLNILKKTIEWVALDKFKDGKQSRPQPAGLFDNEDMGGIIEEE